MADNRDDLLARAIAKYRGSGDFNGLPVRTLGEAEPETSAKVIDLIRKRELDLVRGDYHPNPHIKALAPEPFEDQISKIEADGLGTGCLYPTPEKLDGVDGEAECSAPPYTRALMLGAPQLEFRSFDLRLLEWYRNDPKYYYQVDDVHGQINLRHEFRDIKPDATKDDLELARFGFSYDSELNRAVAIFLWDLHRLPDEHQRMLENYELDAKKFSLHPDFFRTSIIGDWPERISIYDGVLEEKKHINAMCELIGKPPLFRSDHSENSRPAEFAILIRPTKKEFREFSLLLDQLLSDDLSPKFFVGDIETHEVLTRADGSTVKQSIGTITLLENWLAKRFRGTDSDAITTMIADWRKIRKARQKPAHSAEDNDFDQKYLAQQRELIGGAFNAVRTLRMCLENHPKVTGYEVPDYLREGKVWDI